jgi:hypothetical protein
MDSTARLASNRARAASPAVECAPTVVRARSARNLAARNFFSKAKRSPGSAVSARSSARIRVSVSEIASNGDGVDDVDEEFAHKDDCAGDDEDDDDEETRDSSPTSRPARTTMAFKHARTHYVSYAFEPVGGVRMARSRVKLCQHKTVESA